MFSLYSSKVVAPIICISPFASAGLNAFAASIDPAEAPVPIKVCSSSMNKIMSSTCFNSSIIPLILSSNCPLYFVPATIDVKSNNTTLLSRSVLGASPCLIIRARPSMIVVLPTPGLPINTGLFFFFLDKICATLCISSFLPITGSIFPSSAFLVTSVEKLSSIGVAEFPRYFFFGFSFSISSSSGISPKLFVISFEYFL